MFAKYPLSFAYLIVMATVDVAVSAYLVFIQ